MSVANHRANPARIGQVLAVEEPRARVADFVALMKPRVMSLVLFTALVGLLLAPVHRDFLTSVLALLCIAAGAGAAGMLNMWFDADIDAIMARTAMRPIPRALISPKDALGFGVALAVCTIVVMGIAVNLTAAALLAFTIFFYVVVYTMWLKRHTPQNIVIGGAAGAMPPVIGWVASTGSIGLEPMILFLIILLWTPPHFWALSLNRVGDYARAGIPMLPVVAGKSATKTQILIYSTLLMPISLLPWALGFVGAVYGVIALSTGTAMVLLAFRLRRSGNRAEANAADRLFGVSILYLFVLFGALLMDATQHLALTP